GVGDGNLLGSYTHVSEGLVVAMLGYVAVAACFSLLSRSQAAVAPARVSLPSPTSNRMPVVRRVWVDVGIAVLMITIGGARIFAVSSETALSKDLRELP